MLEKLRDGTQSPDTHAHLGRSGNTPWSNPQYRTLFIALLTLAYVFNMMDRQLLAILIEPIKADLSLQDWQLGLLGGTAFSLFYVVMGLPIAKLADRRDRVTILSVCIAVWSVATAISGAVANFAQLLMARIAVAIGEAGGGPPSYSMITDLFKPEKRATATATFIMGSTCGIACGLLFGGWAAETIGWRWAFVAIGLPGILLALVVRLTLKEPPRGFSEGREPTAVESSTVRSVAAVLLTRPAWIMMSLGGAFAGFASYAVILWMPSFYIRVHELSIAETGFLLSIVYFVAGVLGNASGGYVADKLAARNLKWKMLVPGLSQIISIPFLIVAFTVNSLTISIVAMTIGKCFFNFWPGPTYSATQELVGIKMRAVSVSLLLFVVTIIGLGLGPLVIGAVSDLFEANYGQQSLRYALLLVPAIDLLAGLLFYFASHYFARDLQRAPA